MVNTALSDGYKVLYHWQRFDDERLKRTLTDSAIYCSSPSDFNDPWDCKPHFNTDILDDPAEREKHADWAVDVCRRHAPQMSDADLAGMRSTLRNDKQRAAELISQISRETSDAVANRYRVYCLGPDVQNLLMWGHYADSHKGICLEFSLRNEVMCSALRCDYLEQFPSVALHSKSDADDLRVLLTKGKAWDYEKEYRLVAQERDNAIVEGTLITVNGILQLPQGALTAVIVGCQGDYDKVNALVQRTAPAVKVKRAVRVPNRFEIFIQ